MCLQPMVLQLQAALGCPLCCTACTWIRNEKSFCLMVGSQMQSLWPVSCSSYRNSQTWPACKSSSSQESIFPNSQRRIYAGHTCWRLSLSGLARGDAQGARAPPSALGLVNIGYRTASSSTPLTTPNCHLLQNNSLEDT